MNLTIETRLTRMETALRICSLAVTGTMGILDLVLTSPPTSPATKIRSNTIADQDVPLQRRCRRRVIKCKVKYTGDLVNLFGKNTTVNKNSSRRRRHSSGRSVTRSPSLDTIVEELEDLTLVDKSVVKPVEELLKHVDSYTHLAIAPRGYTPDLHRRSRAWPSDLQGQT